MVGSSNIVRFLFFLKKTIVKGSFTFGTFSKEDWNNSTKQIHRHCQFLYRSNSGAICESRLYTV